MPTETMGAAHAHLVHTAEDGFGELTLAVLSRCLDDLRSKQINRAKEAAYAVTQGWMEPWILSLPVSEAALDRVRQLLQAEVAAMRIRWRLPR